MALRRAPEVLWFHVESGVEIMTQDPYRQVGPRLSSPNLATQPPGQLTLQIVTRAGDPPNWFRRHFEHAAWPPSSLTRALRA
jgi:hypothetical protein